MTAYFSKVGALEWRSVLRCFPRHAILASSGHSRSGSVSPLSDSGSAVTKYSCRWSKRSAHPLPLFNGYFFVRIVEQWRSITTFFGVLCLVRVGDCPARCPDQDVDAIKAMIDGHGFIKLPEAPPMPARRKIAVGSKVKITAGPFGGMAGLYAGQSTRERELVLLNLLGRQTPVTIPAGLVAPVQ